MRDSFIRIVSHASGSGPSPRRDQPSACRGITPATTRRTSVSKTTRGDTLPRGFVRSRRAGLRGSASAAAPRPTAPPTGASSSARRTVAVACRDRILALRVGQARKSHSPGVLPPHGTARCAGKAPGRPTVTGQGRPPPAPRRCRLGRRRSAWSTSTAPAGTGARRADGLPRWRTRVVAPALWIVKLNRRLLWRFLLCMISG